MGKHELESIDEIKALERKLFKFRDENGGL